MPPIAVGCESLADLLKDIKESGTKIPGTDLVIVRTKLDGQPCDVLCLQYRTPEGSRLNPVAIMLTPEDAQRIDNPVTHVPGLPWSA